MYKTGDKVIHQKEGACYIVDTVKMDHNRERKEYFLLEPIRDKKARIYISKDSDSNRIRPAITQRQMKEYETIANSNESPWIQDSKSRNKTYQKALYDYDFLEVLMVLKNLIIQKSKKALCTNDTQLLTAAQRLIYSEISIVLNKEYDMVAEKVGSHYLPDENGIDFLIS